MSNKKRLVSSVIQFLTDELQNDSLSTDSKESIEGFIHFFHLIHI
jgi:hypothetical protein